jgi:hypothetical protein
MIIIIIIILILILSRSRSRHRTARVPVTQPLQLSGIFTSPTVGCFRMALGCPIKWMVYVMENP